MIGPGNLIFRGEESTNKEEDDMLDIFQLLDDDHHYQLWIIRFLDIMTDEYITISKMVELTGQSRFRVINFIHALNYDISKFQKNCRIVMKDDILILENIDLTIIKLLQIDYFMKSQIFSLLLYLLEEGGTIEKFATDHFLSVSKAYAIRRQLFTILKSLGIGVKRNRLVGDEFSIRNTLSTLIFEAINGYYSPFLIENDIVMRKVKDLLTFFFNLRLSPTQVKKLEVLISISLIRCKNGKSIDHSFLLDADKYFSIIKNEIYYIANDIFIDPKILVNEFSYVSMFLFTEGAFEEDEDKFNFSYFEALDGRSEKMAKSIIHKIENAYNTEFPPEIQDEYMFRIKQVNRKNEISCFEISSFSTSNQTQSVRELYPTYSEVVWSVIENEFVDKSKDSFTRHFYDYLFILVDVVPPSLLEQPIYICVDFSQGSDYTSFITKQIQGFRDLNFIIEPRVTSRTNILISNCVWDNFTRLQIVWKNPPTPSDWEYLGNAIIRTKRKLLYENIAFEKGELK
jgi:Mga helix-turn-helix domain.